MATSKPYIFDITPSSKYVDFIKKFRKELTTDEYSKEYSDFINSINPYDRNTQSNNYALAEIIKQACSFQKTRNNTVIGQINPTYMLTGSSKVENAYEFVDAVCDFMRKCGFYKFSYAMPKNYADKNTKFCLDVYNTLTTPTSTMVLYLQDFETNVLRNNGIFEEALEYKIAYSDWDFGNPDEDYQRETVFDGFLAKAIMLNYDFWAEPMKVWSAQRDIKSLSELVPVEIDLTASLAEDDVVEKAIEIYTADLIRTGFIKSTVEKIAHRKYLVKAYVE